MLLLISIVLAVLFWNQRNQALLQASLAATAQAKTIEPQQEIKAALATEIASVKIEQATAIAQVQTTLLAEIQKAQAIDTPIPKADITELTPVVSTPNPQAACKDTSTYPKIYRKYEPTQNAEILSIPSPDLTPDAIEHKDEAVGQVKLDLILAPCGVMDHMVMYGSVPYGLTEMAIKAAKRIEFKPALNDGQQVPQMISVIYEFYACPDKVICTKATEDVR
jgi:hypothetical protein